MTGQRDIAWAKYTAAVNDRSGVSPPISARDAGGVGSVTDYGIKPLAQALLESQAP